MNARPFSKVLPIVSSFRAQTLSVGNGHQAEPELLSRCEDLDPEAIRVFLASSQLPSSSASQGAALDNLRGSSVMQGPPGPVMRPFAMRKKIRHCGFNFSRKVSTWQPQMRSLACGSIPQDNHSCTVPSSSVMHVGTDSAVRMLNAR